MARRGGNWFSSRTGWPAAVILAALAGCGALGIGSTDWIPAERRRPFDLSGTFQDLSGRQASLAGYRGNVILLNVWATWCGPCRGEMPSMDRLYRELAREGLVMLAVSNEPEGTLRDFLKNNPYSFTVLRDPQSVLGSRERVSGIPTTFIIDRQGRLAMRRTGSYEWDSEDSMKAIRELLGGS